MSQDIRLYHHPRSPYSRIGVHKIVKSGIEVRAIPFTGPPKGSEFFDPTSNPAKLAYYRMDVGRMTARAGLSIAPPDPFDVDFEPVSMASIAAEQAGFGLSFAHAVAEARWGQGKDLSDPDVIKACAEEIGWISFDTDTASPGLKRAYVQHRRLIEDDGVFGVPFLVSGDEKFWGQDRIDLFLEEMA